MRSCRSLPTGSSANAVTTVVSRPKQRFSPRATLYSPPPSQTSKDRAVWMRRSPGSSRTITSPKLTRSHRQSFFGLIVNPMRSPRPPFRLEHSIDVRRLHCGSQNMNHDKRHQVGGACNEKWNPVTSGPLQDIAHDFGDEHPANRARHSTDPGDGGHCSLGKQIRSQRVKICGEALMARSGEPDQQNGRPQTGHAVGKHDGNDADGTDEHGHFTSRVDRRSPPDHERGQPSSGYAADIGNKINDHDRKSNLSQAYAIPALEEIGHPKEKEPPHWVD